MVCAPVQKIQERDADCDNVVVWCGVVWCGRNGSCFYKSCRITHVGGVLGGRDAQCHVTSVLMEYTVVEYQCRN